MKLEEFIQYAEEYASLGWAIQEQLRDVIAGQPMDDQNPTALAMIGDFLEDMARHCDDPELGANADGYVARIQDYLHTTQD